MVDVHHSDEHRLDTLVKLQPKVWVSRWSRVRDDGSWVGLVFLGWCSSRSWWTWWSGRWWVKERQGRREEKREKKGLDGERFIEKDFRERVEKWKLIHFWERQGFIPPPSHRLIPNTWRPHDLTINILWPLWCIRAYHTLSIDLWSWSSLGFPVSGTQILRSL